MPTSVKSYLLLLVALLLSAGLPLAVQSETPGNEKATAVEISPDDAVEAGSAGYAFKPANPCEGMAQGDFLGSEVCADCHQDKVENMKSSPHGQAADPR